jgi:hypothetical protein
MLLTIITLVALAVLGLLLWVVRSNVGESPSLHNVDTIALRNLLSQADEEYLRDSLTAKDYQRVRRARLRAVQEYLFWIAEDCAVLLAEIRVHGLQSPRETESMVWKAITLRLSSLAFWVLLWIEYLLPGIEIRPGRVFGGYDEFVRSAERYLTKGQPQPAMSTGRG